MSRNDPLLLVLVLLLVGPAWAGCLGTEGSSPGPEVDPGREGMVQTAEDPADSLEMSGCREQIGIFHLDRGQVDPYLPQGFEPMSPVPPDFYDGADPSERTATLLLIGTVCKEPVERHFLAVYVPAVPPEEARVEDVYYHAVALPCTADPDTTEVWEAWGIPCLEGAVEIAPQIGLDVGSAWDLTIEDDERSITVAGTAPASRTQGGAEFVRAFHVEDRRVCAVTDVRVEPHEHWQFGAATLSVEGAPGFPVPRGLGLSSLGQPGIAMNVTRVEDPGLPQAPSVDGCV